jgi:hypothetical protein
MRVWTSLLSVIVLSTVSTRTFGLGQSPSLPPPQASGLILGQVIDASAAPMPTEESMTPSPLVGSTIIVVNDRDIDHFVLQLREGARVSGRVTFEGAVRPETSLVTSTSVYLDRLDERSSGAEPAKPDGFGQFTTAGLPPGTYRLRVGVVPAGWMFKSAMYARHDVADEPFELESEDVTA